MAVCGLSDRSEISSVILPKTVNMNALEGSIYRGLF